MVFQLYRYLKSFVVIFLVVKTERLFIGAELRCEPPQPVTNAVPKIDSQDSYVVGTVVTYKCEKGYRDPVLYELKKADNSAMSQCKVNNSGHAYWTKPSLQCKPQCYSWDLKDVNGLKVFLEGNYMEGENLLFYCTSGYDKVENAVITCNSGIWNSTVMPCQPARCNYSPPSVVNGFTTVSNGSHGMSVSYNCNQFYFLKTPGSIRCSYGHWIGSPAVCKDSRCNSSNLVHWAGFRVKGMKNVYYNLERASVNCKHSYKKMANIICNRGIWTSLSSKHYPCKHGYCRKPKTDGGIVYEGKFCLTSFYCYERARSKYYKEGEKLYITCSQDGVKAQMRCEKGKWTPNLKCKDYEITESKKPSLNRSTATSERKLIIRKMFETYCEIGVYDKDLRIHRAIDGIRLKSGDRIEAGTKIVFHCSYVGIMRLTGVKEMYCYSGEWNEEFPFCFVPTGAEEVMVLVKSSNPKNLYESPRGIYLVRVSAKLHLFCKTVAGLRDVFWVTDARGNIKQDTVYAERGKPIAHIEFHATHAHSGLYTCLYHTGDSVVVQLLVTDFLPNTSQVPKRHEKATSKTESTKRIPKVRDTTTSHKLDSTTRPAQELDTTTSHKLDSTTRPAQELDTTTSHKLDSTMRPAQELDTTTSHKLDSTMRPAQELDTTTSHKFDSTTRPAQELDTTTLHKFDSTTRPAQELDTTASLKLESTTRPPQELDTTTSHKFDSTTRPPQEHDTTTSLKLESRARPPQEHDTTASLKLKSTTRPPQEHDTTALLKLESTIRPLQEQDTTASLEFKSTRRPSHEHNTTNSLTSESRTGIPKKHDSAFPLKLESTAGVQKEHESTTPLMFNTSKLPKYQLDPVVQKNKTHCVVDFNNKDLRIFHKRKPIKSGDIVPDGGRIVFHCYPVGRSRLFGFKETLCHRGRWLDKGFPTCQRNHVLGDVVIEFSRKGVIQPGGVVFFPSNENLVVYCKTIGWIGKPQWKAVTFYASIDYCSTWWEPQCRYVHLQTTSVLSGSYTCYVPHGRTLTIQLSFQEIRCPEIRPKEGLIVTYEEWRKLNNVVRFSCRGSLQLIGAKKAQCLRSGKWSKRIPYCRGQS
ncbi:uncharacterized protein LOC111086480 isoform X2 [Limulus polyphemus]|uniref:Uncharacterized protein LOC111086480 isoform X2 n=1 Tax=Limulus polyphemus TaxID=6850 RepID=A0ABM1SNI8_LIMPO|nr:uncharacterized protein LOC111086480 isoform X2 [Limulus polyphemus]